MRLVPGAVLTALTFVAMSVPAIAYDSTDRAATELPSAEVGQTSKAGGADSKLGIRPEAGVSTQFHEGDFLYVPPPPPNPENPLFYSDSFAYVPAANGARAGQLVRPVSGVIPLSSKGSYQPRAEKRDGKGLGATATPTPTPAKNQPSNQDVDAKRDEGAQAVSPTPVPTANGAEFLASWDDLEDPRFYHGSFVYDPATQSLLPQSRQPALLSVAVSSPGVLSSDMDSNPHSLTKTLPAASTGGASAFPRCGRAMYYNPGIMETVLAFRLNLRHVELCSECVGYVALLGREDLNRRVWLEWEDGDVEGPFLVIDTAAKQHVPSLLSRNWVIDVDYETAVRRGMNRPLPVTVWVNPPRTQKPRIAEQDGLIDFKEAAYAH